MGASGRKRVRVSEADLLADIERAEAATCAAKSVAENATNAAAAAKIEMQAARLSLGKKENTAPKAQAPVAVRQRRRRVGGRRQG